MRCQQDITAKYSHYMWDFFALTTKCDLQVARPRLHQPTCFQTACSVSLCSFVLNLPPRDLLFVSFLCVKSHMLPTRIMSIRSSGICQDTESLSSIKERHSSHSPSLCTWQSFIVFLSSCAPPSPLSGFHMHARRLYVFLSLPQSVSAFSTFVTSDLRISVSLCVTLFFLQNSTTLWVVVQR